AGGSPNALRTAGVTVRCATIGRCCTPTWCRMKAWVMRPGRRTAMPSGYCYLRLRLRDRSLRECRVLPPEASRVFPSRPRFISPPIGALAQREIGGSRFGCNLDRLHRGELARAFENTAVDYHGVHV